MNELLLKAEVALNNLIAEIVEASRINFEDTRDLMKAKQEAVYVMAEIRLETQAEEALTRIEDQDSMDFVKQVTGRFMNNTNYKDAELYAELWSDAYSADRMGREISILVIQAMLDFGLGRDKSEWVYRSKHLRWFFDMTMTVEDAHEKMTSYLFHNGNDVQDDLKTVRLPYTALRVARNTQQYER